jgi:nitrogen fixation protein FixH
MKLHWGNYIAIFFLCFVVFILFLVSKTFKVNNELVSEDYYDKEIAFQDKINKLEATKSFKAQLVIQQVNDSVEVEFPSKFSDDLISGTIQLFRPSDLSKDITVPVHVLHSKQTIACNQLIKGVYVVHVDWASNNHKFYTERKIYIK